MTHCARQRFLSRGGGHVVSGTHPPGAPVARFGLYLLVRFVVRWASPIWSALGSVSSASRPGSTTCGRPPFCLVSHGAGLVTTVTEQGPDVVLVGVTLWQTGFGCP